MLAGTDVVLIWKGVGLDWVIIRCSGQKIQTQLKKYVDQSELSALSLGCVGGGGCSKRPDTDLINFVK